VCGSMASSTHRASLDLSSTESAQAATSDEAHDDGRAASASAAVAAAPVSSRNSTGSTSDYKSKRSLEFSQDFAFISWRYQPSRWVALRTWINRNYWLVR